MCIMPTRRPTRRVSSDSSGAEYHGISHPMKSRYGRSLQRTLAERGVGDIAGMMKDSSRPGMYTGAALALLRRGVAGVPHEVVGDEHPALFKCIQQRDRPVSPMSGVAPSTSTMGKRRRPAAMASPSLVWAFSRTRNASSSAWKVLRSTTLGVPSSSLMKSCIVLSVGLIARALELVAGTGRWE